MKISGNLSTGTVLGDHVMPDEDTCGTGTKRVSCIASLGWILLCVSWPGCGGEAGSAASVQDPPPKQPDLRQLTSELRERIDHLADRAQVEADGGGRIDFSGKPVAWAISQVGLEPKQEREEAEKVHQAILERVRTATTPEPAMKLFRKLIEALPKYQTPDEFQWELTTIEDKDVNAFTCGGGFVYVHQPLFDVLLADRSRSLGALAFVLAHEIGHVALGHCRRGYQRQRIEDELGDDIERNLGGDRKWLGKILRTGINAGGHLVKFLYSRDQEYEADLFALHLCRNAGLEPTHVLDGLRWLAMLQHPRMISEPDFAPADGEGGGLGVLSEVPSPHVATIASASDGTERYAAG
jgi:hypothetical protein